MSKDNKKASKKHPPTIKKQASKKKPAATKRKTTEEMTGQAKKTKSFSVTPTIQLKKGAKSDRITKRGSATTEAPKSKKGCTCQNRQLDTDMFTQLNIVKSWFTRKYIAENYVPCECFNCGKMWVDKVREDDPPKTTAVGVKTRIMCCKEAQHCENECQHAYCGECYDKLCCDHEGNTGKSEPTIKTVTGRRSRA